MKNQALGERRGHGNFRPIAHLPIANCTSVSPSLRRTHIASIHPTHRPSNDLPYLSQWVLQETLVRALSTSTLPEHILEERRVEEREGAAAMGWACGHYTVLHGVQCTQCEQRKGQGRNRQEQSLRLIPSLTHSTHNPSHRTHLPASTTPHPSLTPNP